MRVWTLRRNAGLKPKSTLRSATGIPGAPLLQVLGLLAERWLFFAQARHPQNLYYQTVS